MLKEVLQAKLKLLQIESGSTQRSEKTPEVVTIWLLMLFLFFKSL